MVEEIWWDSTRSKVAKCCKGQNAVERYDCTCHEEKHTYTRRKKTFLLPCLFLVSVISSANFHTFQSALEFKYRQSILEITDKDTILDFTEVGTRFSFLAVTKFIKETSRLVPFAPATSSGNENSVKVLEAFITLKLKQNRFAKLAEQLADSINWKNFLIF